MFIWDARVASPENEIPTIDIIYQSVVIVIDTVIRFALPSVSCQRRMLPIYAVVKQSNHQALHTQRDLVARPTFFQPPSQRIDQTYRPIRSALAAACST
mgnify:CR=1 FL=1